MVTMMEVVLCLPRPDQGTASRDYGPCRLLPPDSGRGSMYGVHRVYTFTGHSPPPGAMVVWTFHHVRPHVGSHVAVRAGSGQHHAAAALRVCRAVRHVIAWPGTARR